MAVVQSCLWIFLATLWAGVALSGNLVAAPAKFQVAALDVPLALQVGRAQFAWIGRVEWVLLVGLLLVCLLSFRMLPTLLVVAVSLFLIQQFALQPMLQERSDLIIAGQDVPSSHLHLIFAGVEAIKIITLLIFVGFGGVGIARSLVQSGVKF